MKIAIINDMIYPYSKGGIEVRNLELAKILSKKHEVHLYGAKLWKNKSNFTKDNIHYHGVHEYKEIYNMHGKRNAKDPYLFAKKLKLDKDFDIVDCSSSTYFPAIEASKFCKKHNIPLIVTWNEVWGDYWNEYATNKFSAYLGKRTEKKVINLTKNIVAVSKLIKQRLIKLGAEEKNITIIPNGVNLKKINKAKLLKTKYDIIYAGRLQKFKNVDLIIEAIRVLDKKIKAVICGNGPELNKLKQLSKKYNLNITFTGEVNQDKLYSYLKSSKIFILPSEIEGFGIAAIEAAAAKLPVITIDSERNAAIHLIKQGKTGLIMKKDRILIAKAAEILLNNSKARKRLGIEAYKEVQKNYTWEKAAKKLESLYTKLAQK